VHNGKLSSWGTGDEECLKRACEGPSKRRGSWVVWATDTKTPTLPSVSFKGTLCPNACLGSSALPCTHSLLKVETVFWVCWWGGWGEGGEGSPSYPS
jgi:hypothetical protein